MVTVFVRENDVELLNLIPAAVKGDSGKQGAEYNQVCNAGQTAELRSSHMGFGIHSKWDSVA